MPINLRPLYAEETEKASQDRLLTLVKLTAPASLNLAPLYFVDSNYPIHYGYTDEINSTGDITYIPLPLKFQGINTTTDGSVDKSSLTIGNVVRDIMYYVGEYEGLSKWRVSLKFVYEKFLNNKYAPDHDGTVVVTPNEDADPQAYLEEEYFIDTYTATDKTVTFTLEPIIDLTIQLPRRRFMTDSCFWRYKDPLTCKYLGDLENCKKTLKDCKERDNQQNFGGFPGVTGVRRLFL